MICQCVYSNPALNKTTCANDQSECVLREIVKDKLTFIIGSNWTALSIWTYLNAHRRTNDAFFRLCVKDYTLQLCCKRTFRYLWECTWRAIPLVKKTSCVCEINYTEPGFVCDWIDTTSAPNDLLKENGRRDCFHKNDVSTRGNIHAFRK